MTPLMLPAAPKDVGRLSDVFTSALATVGGGGENRLRLPKVRHSVVILVDGLGFENIRNASAYARFLNSKSEQSIRCEFPSTTATSITGFATGLRSGEHGLIGYAAYDREKAKARNLLTGWTSASEASDFKLVPALSENPGSVRISVVGPAVYETSGFTELTMKAADYVPAQAIADRFEAVRKLVRSNESSLTYLYIPELDQLAHKFGVDSQNWLAGLEDLDHEISDFITVLPAGVGVLITADHGVIDVPFSRHVYLDDFDWFTEGAIHTAGDPRCNFVYLNHGITVKDFRAKLESTFGEIAYICTSDELIENNWMTPFTPQASSLLPDLYIIWKDSMVAYDRRFAKDSHLKMIGQHGAISDAEMRVPLIRMGSY